MPKKTIKKENGWLQSGLLPYGLLPTLAAAGDAAPRDWRNQTNFIKWRQDQLDLINEILWPRCDAKKKTWEGAAFGTMEALTREDLDIMQDLRKPGPERLIDTLPVSALRHLACPPHKTFFDSEDSDSPKTAENLRFYDRDASKELFIDALPVLFSRGSGRKCPLEMIFWFKQQLQRPRPYQAGLVLQMEFSHEGSKLGLHPAMISGHCIQGMCALIGATERILLNQVQLLPDTWGALHQFCVDYGDRRVMAGVHYPSDNLASWIIALDLCDQTVEPELSVQVKEHLWLAIRDHSLIFKRIKANVDAGGSVFHKAYDLLKSRAPEL